MRIPIAPAPSILIKPQTCISIENAFDDIEINKIEKIALDFPTETGKFDNAIENEKIRKCQIRRIKFNQSNEDIFFKISECVRHINGKFFDFNLYGFEDDLQFTIYDKIGSHYEWHIDQSPDESKMPRKLSVSIQLTADTEYEGGDLEIFNGLTNTKTSRKKGSITVFPSYSYHRVTPLMSGVRKSLVCWIVGERFR